MGVGAKIVESDHPVRRSELVSESKPFGIRIEWIMHATFRSTMRVERQGLFSHRVQRGSQGNCSSQLRGDFGKNMKKGLKLKSNVCM